MLIIAFHGIMRKLYFLLKRLVLKSGMIFLALTCFLCPEYSLSQTSFRAQVRDSHTGEPIPFASLKSVNDGRGKFADSLGFFDLKNWNDKDSVMISSAGYLSRKIAIFSTADSFYIIELDHRSFSEDVIVRASVNKGLYVWRKIRERIDLFNPYNRENIGFDQYNKLEVDINNLNLDKLRRNIFLKPFSFIINPLSKTTDSAGFIPAYLLETKSFIAYQNNPNRKFEYVEAINNRGFLDESVAGLTTELNVNVNIFQDYIRLFQREIAGPFHPNAPQFYRFSIADTQRLNDHSVFHLTFFPKNKTLDLFSGDAWIESGSFNILRLSIYLGDQSGMNFLKRFTLYQEFKPQVDSSLFVTREKFYADLKSFGGKSLSLTARKTSVYSALQMNSDSLKTLFSNQTLPEKTSTISSALTIKENSWDSIRPEPLSEKEKLIYKTIDNLSSNPEYESLKDKFKFAGSGYLNIGSLELGRWFTLFSGNQWEGFRTRLDLGTNKKFSKNLHLHGYIAYGTRDKKIKGLAEAFWISERGKHWTQWHGRYISDVDNGIDQPTNLNSDNVFALAIRKPGSIRKFLFTRQALFSVQRDLFPGFRFETVAAFTEIEPLQNLPSKNSFPVNTINGKPLHNFEIAGKLRFSANEKNITGDFFRYPVSNPYPVVQLIAGYGIPGLAGSDYRYWRLGADISGKTSLKRMGTLRYAVFAERYYGKLPFAFLGNLNGNDGYYFNPNANNLMYRFEYLSDRYAGFKLEQHFGQGIFRFTKFTRKLKWSQFWSFRTTWSDLSEENKNYNKSGNYFKTLDGKPYTEFGTGIENIFRVLRIDFIWRLSPQPLPSARESRFGIFGSFRFRL